MLAAASAAVIVAFTAPEASSVGVHPTAGLNSGSYPVVVVTAGGKSYPSTWHLQVVANRITGTSEWDCCPGFRIDRLAGTLTDDGQTEPRVSITRFCTGQGQPGPCEQVYRGAVDRTRIEGSWSGTGGSGTWTLYLDRVDLKFTVRAGGGKSARLLLDDAQLLGGGRLVDLSYDNYAQKGAAVLALRLAYTGGTEVRASLRLPTTGRITGVLKHDFDDHQDILFLGLQVFQSNRADRSHSLWLPSSRAACRTRSDRERGR